jgi:alpha/beta superfamily hydrolase
MTEFNYAQTFEKVVDGEVIEYGIVHGNENIVFIKTGAGGNIGGYQDKYLKIARRIHQRLGATVICASNPYIEDGHETADCAMISKVAADCGFTRYEVSFIGTSDGGYHNLLLAYQVPQTVKLLGINPSLITTDGLVEQLQKIPQVKKVLVFGTEDDDFECVPLLQRLDCNNLEILTVEGADHDFTGMVEEFIALTDLL